MDVPGIAEEVATGSRVNYEEVVRTEIDPQNGQAFDLVVQIRVH